jgi:hypothetical protein
LSELEISWASGEHEELDCTNREIDEDVMEPETPWIRWKKQTYPLNAFSVLYITVKSE